MSLKIFLHILFLTTTTILFSCSKSQVDKSETLVIGSFNIEWLGDGINDNIKRDESDYKRIADLIKDCDADILGLQEIENVTAIKRIMKYLPDFRYIIGNTGSKQNPALIYKKDCMVEFITNYTPLAIKSGRTRAGLIINAKKGTFDWIMMVVHLKSTSRYDSTEALRIESFEIRKRQAEILRAWADSTAEHNEKDIIILGDFNDNPNRNKQQNMSPLTWDNKYLFLTKDEVSCANPRWDMIDHIVVNQSASSRYLVNSLFVYNIYHSYSESELRKVSDHCPVIASFNITMPDND